MSIIGTLPVTLTNGTLADANQVMSDLNAIVSSVNANAAQLSGGNAFTGTQTINGKTIANNTDLASSSGSTLIGDISAGTGAVSRTQRSKNSDLINVKDFGAVADGVWNNSTHSSSGTDNLAFFNAAIAAAVSLGVSRVKASGVFYLSAGFTLSRGITLEGDGSAHLPVFMSGTVRGTVLLINGAVSGDCIAFEQNAGHSGLRDLSVYNTNTNDIQSVVSIIGHLYPRLKNVETSSLRKTTGVGFYIAPSATGATYSTLWGDFDNCMATITDIGLATEASVRWGLKIWGINSTKVCNANSFRAGQFAGTWGGLLHDGAAASSGALSNVFHGVKFDAIWDGTFTPQYQTAAQNVYGFTKANCYIFPTVQIKRGVGLAFSGCYLESTGSPGTYNDGSHGVQSLISVAWLDDPIEVTGTGFVDCNWNGCYLYDNGSRTLCTPTTGGYKHDNRLAVHTACAASGVQSGIVTSTWTKVLTSSVVFGDTSELEWDAINGVMNVRSTGTYLINAQVEMAGWAVSAGTYAKCRIVAGGYTDEGSQSMPNGAGTPISSQISTTFNLSRGDTITFQVLHNQGTNQSTSGSNTYFKVLKV